MASPRSRRPAAALAACALALGLVAAGCGDDGSSADSGLSGTIAVDGSSTVAPLTSAAAEAFNEENSGVDITVGTSGTGGGFEVFCKGETDISNASRKIKDEEAAACAAAGVEYEELRVASDGITLVTKSGAEIGKERNLTKAQLKAIWGADSKIENWKDIPGGKFEDAPLTLAGPGSQSGTYDFFNEEILGEGPDGETLAPRQDYSASEDDNVTITAIESAKAGLGYFGFTYFEDSAGRLEAFAVDGVSPDAETITDGTYPLSRPLYIYVSKKSLARPEVLAFTRYYLENGGSLAEEQRFVPAPQADLDAGAEKLAAYE